MKKKLQPYLNIGPGDFIREELEFRDWTQQDLSDIIDVSFQHLSDIVNNKKPISIEIAKKLSQIFEQSPQYWLNLSNNFQLRLHEDVLADEMIAKKEEIYRKLPVRDLVKRKFLPNPKDNENFLEVAGKMIDSIIPSNKNLKPQIAFKKSVAHKQFSPDIAHLWYSIAKLLSKSISVPVYTKEKLEALAKGIKKYTTEEDGVAKFINDLNKTGVKCFIMQHLERTYIDGASFYEGDNPVVVYTMRFNRIDNFWFTIAHEIGHILLHFEDKAEYYLDDVESKTDDDKEKQANEYAMRILGTNRVIEYFEKYFKVHDSEIIKVAREINIHPSIVSGALKFAGILSPKRMNKKEFGVDPLLPVASKYDKIMDFFCKPIKTKSAHKNAFLSPSTHG